MLTAHNQSTSVSVCALNERIRALVNPGHQGKTEVSVPRVGTFRDGDQVIITKNNQNHFCVNGDMGTLRVQSAAPESISYSVEISARRTVKWQDDYDGLRNMSLAYALTTHESQGGEYDSILMPVTMAMRNMLNRHWFYTAISRARKQVVFYGEPKAIEWAMTHCPPARRSMLVPKTRMYMLRKAS